MRFIDSLASMCFIVQGAVCLVICIGGWPAFGDVGVILAVGGGTFEKIINYIMYCRM